MFIFAILTGIIAVAALIFGLRAKFTERQYGETVVVKTPNVIAKCIAGALALLTAGLLWGSMSYTQQAGEAKVLKDWTGTVVDDSTTTGLHFKSPLVSTIDFDITNNTVAFISDGSKSFNGQQANGPQITFTDKDGATGNIDVVVTYSIQPDAVRGIFTKYTNQENFLKKLIEQDVRSVTREVPAKYGTLSLLTSREKLSVDLVAALNKKWAGKGIIVDQVSPQEIRYSDNVKKRFDDAQSARIDNEKAKAELQTASINAKQKIVVAEAEAEANRKLAASLTAPILQQRYIDALAKSQFMVVPDGGGSIINIPTPAAK
jgi:regulator of protease activity HflC (stomatin/prohibitin superfamily)